MKFSIKNFFGKCDQIRRKLRIWSHLLKKPLMKNFIFLCGEIFNRKLHFFHLTHDIVKVPPKITTNVFLVGR